MGMSNIGIEIKELLSKLEEKIEALKLENERLKREYEKELDKRFTTQFLEGVNTEEFKKFIKEPYCIIPKKQDEWYVIAPKFIDFQLGWLERQTKSYNIFIVNKYMQWFYTIPEALKDKLKFKPPLPFTVFDNMLLTGEEYQDVAWGRYRDFLLRREGKDRIRIKPGKEFQLIAKMIDDGILPFIPTSISSDELRGEPENIKLRDYQKAAWKKFRETGAVIICWPFGAGKTFFGLYAMYRVKGKHLVIVPTLTLKEQWKDRIFDYLPNWYDVTVETYHAFRKVRDKQWTITIYDECHRLPADTFSRLATIKTKYRIGLSATPYREDGRTNYIFALTGFPVGIDWDSLKKIGVFTPPDIRLYILKNKEQKIRKVQELLLAEDKKTLIYCDSISLGKRLSSILGIPFIFGDTPAKKRMEILQEAENIIISRIGDEGVSLPDLERVIEVDFLYGSRRQEGQRMGRLLHGGKKGEHYILMTEEEFKKYEKRLYALYEKGFKIELIR